MSLLEKIGFGWLDRRLRKHYTGWPQHLGKAGDYWWPVISPKELQVREQQLFPPKPGSLPGIDLRANEQLALLRQLAPLIDPLPIPRHRYHTNDPWYAPGEGMFLQGLMRFWKPQRIIEVGSGFSSAIMLDTNEYYLNRQVQLTFIDPNPQRLKSLLKPEDRAQCTIHEQSVCDVDLAVFKTLAPGDILFIDSSHVLRLGSDFNRLLFEVIPILPSGCHIHIHDIFWPFEYPKDWALGGRSWTEIYAIRALLTHNPSYRIDLFTDYLVDQQQSELKAILPQFPGHGGSALWITRV